MESKTVNTPSTEGKAPEIVTNGTTPANIATIATALSQLPEGYLANGYYVAGTEDPDVKYVRDIAVEIAKKLTPMNKRTFEAMYREIDNMRWLDLPHKQLGLNRLVAVAANLVKKGKAPAILLDFCKVNAAAVKTEMDWTFFCYHIEAVCGYMD